MSRKKREIPDIYKPSVILGDEPTGNLDSKTSQEVMDVLFSINKHHGTTMLIVTHDPKIASRCDRILQMADGNIIKDTVPNSEEE